MRSEPLAAPESEATPARYTQTIPATQVDFDLVLVPGNEEAGIPPLYVGVHEVTWDMYLPWAVCDDVEDRDEHPELRFRKLRPSLILDYIDVTRGFGIDGFPALSMTRISSELFCAWLSDQTGHRFRLPTEDEWQHIYRSGGGSVDTAPLDPDAVAVYQENSIQGETGTTGTRPVGSKKPNRLGIHDMAGNAWEWVSTAEGHLLRGGSFTSPASELGVGRRDRPPRRKYPSESYSIWWFSELSYRQELREQYEGFGFRVVREL